MLFVVRPRTLRIVHAHLYDEVILLVRGNSKETMVMNLELSDEQARELLTLLGGVLGDLSHEIASTDNAEYRVGLRHRRDLLAAIHSSLEASAISD